jgi:hypothetical protein
VLFVADDAFAPMEPADAALWSDAPLLAAEPAR